MNGQERVSLWIEFPVTGQWGTVEELHARHELEHLLEAALARQRLGVWEGAGQGLGVQDLSFGVPRQRWEAAWALVRAELARLGVLGRAKVELFVDEGPPRRLWPPSQPTG
jgi:hypothetical protein